MILSEFYNLSNGLSIPQIALGTWQVTNDDVVQAVKDALSIGYRHIDTAAAYENEQGVAKGIKESKIERSDIFVTTKIPAEVKNYDEAKK